VRVATIVLLSLFAQASPLRSADTRIVPAYRGLEQFGWAQLSRPDTPAASTYDRLVIEPYAVQCGLSTGPFQLLGPGASPFEAITIAQQIEAADVVSLAAAALKTAVAALPSPGPLAVCLYAGALDGAIFHLGGTGGVALGNGRIKLFLYPTVNGFTRVRYTVAHEYHHEALRRLVGPASSGGTLGAMVAEGKADYFATFLHPTLRPKHTLPLADEELARVWQAFERMRDDDVASFRSRFMIAAQSDLPLWAGYRLAYEIVDACVGEQQRRLASDWLGVDPRTCLERFRAGRRGRSLR